MLKFHIPIKLPSLANLGGKLRDKLRTKRLQREATMYCLVGLDLPPLPVTVTITRIGPRKLDDDNLAAACKYVRDQIAATFKEDDGSDRYTWKYEQRITSNKKYGVDVQVVRRDTE